MLIPEAEVAFLHRLQELGEDNVYIGGSLLMALMGIRREVKDIDIILDKPTPAQLALREEYKGTVLDFLLYRGETPLQKDLRYRGIPLDSVVSMVQFKAERAVRKDFLDLLTIMQWLVTAKPEGIQVEESIQSILHEVLKDRQPSFGENLALPGNPLPPA